jgi:hypothetical protein
MYADFSLVKRSANLGVVRALEGTVELSLGRGVLTSPFRALRALHWIMEWRHSREGPTVPFPGLRK